MGAGSLLLAKAGRGQHQPRLAKEKSRMSHFYRNESTPTRRDEFRLGTIRSKDAARMGEDKRQNRYSR